MSADKFLDLFEFNITQVKLPFRVYKKTKELYRIEQRTAQGWLEVRKDEPIERMVLEHCAFVVEEKGRRELETYTFTSSAEVPVHAWIECASVHSYDSPFQPSGILYYNPFTVRCFMDRASYEAGQPKPLQGALKVRIAGNFLEYQGGSFFAKPDALLPKKLNPTTPAPPEPVVATESLIWG